MTPLETQAALSKAASMETAALTQTERNAALLSCAAAIESNADAILAANKKDVEAAETSGLKPAFLERLTLTPARVSQMAQGLRDVAALPDPLSAHDETKVLENGLILTKKRVPLGVVGVIFESRPNVSADSFAICFKAGNAVILRGGKEALNSNLAITAIIRQALSSQGINENAVYCLSDTSRETANALMRLNAYVDVLVPRGGAGLINSVIQNATVPAIQTGVGNCHIYVDESADQDMAINIIVNAKTSRPGVCNAAEKLLIHKSIAAEFLPKIYKALTDKNVELRGDAEAVKIAPLIKQAEPEDWQLEYEDLIMAIAITEDLPAAIAHITKFSTGHSEAIITNSYKNAAIFTNAIDAAAVYVNASTRFTDGGCFGKGAEIGISTQKLHARGPMGVFEMTTTKYIILGQGQIR